MNTLIHWYETICRFFFWGWKLRKSYDWDHGYLMEVIHLKLSRMENSLLKDKKGLVCVWQSNTKDRSNKALRTAVELSRRIVNNEFHQNLDKLIEKEGYDNVFKNSLTRNSSKKSRIDKEFTRAVLKDSKMEDLTYEMFYDIMKKWSRCWWS